MVELTDHLKGILDTLPVKPGCYIMKNAAGEVIYVGKAINLRNRVRSYFQERADHDRKALKLVEQIADIEWIVVGSELEALILEMNLIKKHRPHYNVRLKDDKRYPYIKVHWRMPFPKVTVTRQMVDDGARYFGPYTSVWAVHQTLDVLRRIFPYLTCDREITGQDARACLYYDIKLCSGPVHRGDRPGRVPPDDRRSVRLPGGPHRADRQPACSRRWTWLPRNCTSRRRPRCATRLQAIERVVEKQKVITSDQIDSDVIAMARADGEACVQVFFIRNGKLIGREYFILEGTEDIPDAEVMAEFIKQFYTEAASHP